MRDPGFRQSRSSSSRSSSSSFNYGAQRVLALKQPSRVGRSYENCSERDVLMQCHSLLNPAWISAEKAGKWRRESGFSWLMKGERKSADPIGQLLTGGD